MHWRAVAENDDLPGILDDLIASSLDFAHEQIHADEALYVAGLASNNGTFLHRLRCKEVMEPDLGREGRVAGRHAQMMTQQC